METFNFSKTFSFQENPTTRNKKFNSTFTTFSATSQNFFNQEEYKELKLRREALDQKIKFRKDFENTYTNLKLNELEKEIEEIKFKNSISQKRNEDLLTSIQKDIYKCHQIVKISDESKSLLENEQKRYKNYLSYQLQNIKKEFEQKMLTKNIEMQNIHNIMDSQLKQKEEISRIENEYVMKISRMNDDLVKKINNINEEKTKIDNMRNSVREKFSLIEENSCEAIVKIYEDGKEKLDTVPSKLVNKGEIITNQKEKSGTIDIKPKVQPLVQKSSINIINELPSEKEKFNYQDVINAPESKIEKFQNIKIKEKNPSDIMIKNNPSKSAQENKNINTIVKTQNETNNSHADSSIIVENKNKNEIKNDTLKNLSKRKSGLFSDMRKKKQEEEKNLQENSFTKIKEEKDQSLSRDILKENTYYIENRNNSFKEDIPSNSHSASFNYLDEKTSSQNNPNNINFLKFEESMISNKNPVKNNSSLNDNNNFSMIKNETYADLEKIIRDKLDLTKISKSYKLEILNNLLTQIEKNAKSIKPNNPSTYLYQTKHMNLNSNKENIKIKFFEILQEFLDKSTKNENIENILKKISNDMLIFISLELLNSNSNPNLNPENLKLMEYNLTIFENDLDINYSKEFFDLISTQIKKLILDKKTSPNIAANVLASSLMNFEKDQRMTSNLVAVLERKLTDKIAPAVGGWGQFHFNSKIIFE